MRGARIWVTVFIVTLTVFGVGQIEAWPFTSWYMFSHVEQTPSRVARAVAVTASGDRTLDDRTLPYGLLSHRLLRRVDDAGTAAARAALCASLVRATRATVPSATAVRVEERRWDPLVRGPRNTPVFSTLERLRCEA